MSDIDTSLNRKLKDIAAGFIGGATQVLIGQPVDLVKIRLQMSTTPTTSAQVIKNVIRNEGLLAFIKAHCLRYSALVRVCRCSFTGFMNANVSFKAEQ